MESIADVLAALTQGGRELADNRQISPDTLQKIEQPITDFDGMARVANIAWQACIDRGITPAELRKKRVRPRP